MARRPYERREDEGDQAFEAFAEYRDAGADRSQRVVAEGLGKSLALISRWASAYSWVKRVHAYDMEVDRRKRVGALRGVEDMRRRQIKLGQDMQELGGIELRKMLREAKKHSKADTLEQGLVMKLVDLGSKLERLNRGEPGEIVQNVESNAVDLSGLTVEQLRVYREVGQKLRAQTVAQAEVAAAVASDGGAEGEGVPVH